MYMRYYDGYPSDTFDGRNEKNAFEDDFVSEEVISPEEIKISLNSNFETDSAEENRISSTPTDIQTKSFLPSSIKSDDIILIALLFILISENSDDYIMPLVIGALLLGR